MILALLLAATATVAGPCPPVLSRCEVALVEKLGAWRADSLECRVRLEGAAEIVNVTRAPIVAASPPPGPAWGVIIGTGGTALAIGVLLGILVGGK